MLKDMQMLPCKMLLEICQFLTKTFVWPKKKKVIVVIGFLGAIILSAGHRQQWTSPYGGIKFKMSELILYLHQLFYLNFGDQKNRKK